MNAEKKQEKLWTPQFILLIMMGAMSSIGFYMVNPSMAKYAVSLGASVATAGVITGMFSITALVVRPLSGLAADRINRKTLLITATLVMAAAAFGYSMAQSIQTLVLFRIIHGIAFSVNGTVNVAMVASLCPKSRISEGVGYYGIANIFGTAFGPSLGLGLGDLLGFRVSFAISGILILIGACIGMTIRKNEAFSPSNKGKRFSFGDLLSLKVLPIAIFGGIFSMSNGIITSYLALTGEARKITGISLYFSVNALLLLFVRPFAGKFADRKSPKSVVCPAMFFDGLALFTIGSAHSLKGILLAALFKAVGQGAGQPVLQAQAIKKLPPEKSGVASSTFYIGADIGQGAGPMLAGAAVDGFGADSEGYRIMFSLFSCMFLVGIAGYLVYSKLTDKSTKENSSS